MIMVIVMIHVIIVYDNDIISCRAFKSGGHIMKALSPSQKKSLFVTRKRKEKGLNP